MSKIGKKPVQLEEGVMVTVVDRLVTVVGPKGELKYTIPKGINVIVKEGKVVVSQKDNISETRALFGLTRALIANMVKGVLKGFEKRLEMTGVGYRAQLSGRDLILSVGYSHPVKVSAVEGIVFSVADNGIVVSGIDSVLVGDMSARIRAIRPPEPYKGKGIKYKGEKIRRKAGKAAKAVGAK